MAGGELVLVPLAMALLRRQADANGQGNDEVSGEERRRE